jgi:hypothetical protein
MFVILSFCQLSLRLWALNYAYGKIRIQTKQGFVEETLIEGVFFFTSQALLSLVTIIVAYP